MSRLRYNNSVGTLGASLTSTGTTITFAVAPSWSTIVSPDYIPLVLEPPGATPNANFEVVYVTAYTAGATTATIVRGQEGTTAVAHSSGVTWMVAPTTSDFPTGLTYTPAAAPPPSRAYRASALNINGATKIPLDTIDNDPNGYIDVTANGRYNVPAAGRYLVIGQVFFNTAPSDGNIMLYKNGSPESFGTEQNGSVTFGQVASTVMTCNAGDYIELWAFTQAGTNIALRISSAKQQNFLSVVPLSQQSIASQITPVAARAFRSAAFSFTTSTFVKVPIDTLSFDTGSGMDATTNHRYNIPVSGYYQIEGNINATDNTTYAALYKNGTRFAESGAYGVGGQGGGVTVVSDVVQCQAGDFIELWVFSSSGSIGVGPGSATNYLSVAQVSAQPGANLAAARAYRNAALSLTASTWTKVPLDTVSFDPNGNMDVATNHRYNVPAAGPYLVTAAVQAGGTLSIQAGIYKNGSRVSQVGQEASGASGLSAIVDVTDIVQCNAGDYLELWAWAADTSINVGSNVTFLAVTPLVSAVASTPGFGSSGSSSAATNVARAYRNAALSPTANTATKVPFDTLSFDPSSSMDVATNHRYNVPVAGYYQVDATITQQVAGGYDMQVWLYRNGGLVTQGTTTHTNGFFTAVSASDVFQCAAGDYIEVYVYSGSSGALSLGSQNSFLSVAQIQAPSGSGNANALPAGASYQNGVINSTDLAISALSINTSTGALTFTLASAVPVIIKDASGLLIPVTFTGSTFTISPPTLPTTSNSRVIGVEIDANGQVSLVSGASVAGQQSTASTIETNTASITPGRLRVADIGVYNNAGAYNFSNASTTATQGTNWVDRRPWARGALSIQQMAQAAVTGSTAASWQVAPTPQVRVESTGTPVRVKLTGFIGFGNAGQEFSMVADVDGGIVVGDTTQYPAAAVAAVQFYDATSYQSGAVYEAVITGLSPGSHLLRLMTKWYAGSAPSFFASAWVVEELLKVNANNGTV